MICIFTKFEPWKSFKDLHIEHAEWLTSFCSSSSLSVHLITSIFLLCNRPELVRLTSLYVILYNLNHWSRELAWTLRVRFIFKIRQAAFLNIITFKTAEIPNGFIFYDICVIEFLKLNFCKFFRMIPRVARMISNLTSGDWFFTYSNQVEN